MEKFKPPLSGEVLGVLVEAFDLRTLSGRTEFTGVLQDRTARSYFQGERVKDESARRIIRAVAEGLVAAGLFPADIPGCAELDLTDLLTRVLVQHAAQWDYIAGDLAVYTPPLERPALAAFPYLKFAVIDVALRIAALMWLEKKDAHQPKEVPAWAKPEGRSALLHDLIRRCEKPMTRDRLLELVDNATDRVSYAFSTVDRWLAKEDAARPVQKHLEILADIFAREIPGASRAAVLRSLRLHYGLHDLCETLASSLGRRMVEGLACALVTYVMCAREFVAQSTLPEDQLRRSQLASLTRGTAFSSNAFVLRGLSRCEELPLWKADLVAAFGGIVNWRPRIEHYVRALPAVEATARHIRDLHPDRSEDDVLETALSLTWSRAEDLPADMQGMFRECMDRDSLFAAAQLEQRGLDFVSTGGFSNAAVFFLNATVKDPTNASMHFNLSAALTSLGRLQEALNEAHVAALLDPGMDLAAAQIGIVLIEMGRHREASEALESRARNLRAMTAHYAYHLGLAYYHDRQFQRALDVFEQCLRLEGDHPDTLDLAAACLLELGDRRKGREYAKRAHHLGRSETWNKLSSGRMKE